jgi:UDP-glucose 4-epimerase
MKYLVTGSAGFIGGNLCNELHRSGHEVVGLDIKQTADVGSWQQIQGTITDLDKLTELAKEVDGVFHLAAVASVPMTIENPAYSHSVNVTGTLNVFESARRASGIPVVYASSAAIYGNNDHIPLSESESPRFLSPYAAHKYTNEVDAKSYGETFALPTFGLRLFNIYGPGQDPSSPYSGVISIFYDRLMKKQSLTLYGDGSQTRDFVAVKDAVQCLIGAMKHSNANAPVSNVCTGDQITLLELIDTLAEVLSEEANALYQPSRRGDILYSCGNPEHLKNIMGFKPQTKLKEGLQILIDNY